MAELQGDKYRATGKVIDLGTLTSGSPSDTIHMDGCHSLDVAVTVATIGTNVVLRLEGSQDETNWFNLDLSRADTTLTENGNYRLRMEKVNIHQARLLYVSSEDGTPVVSAKVKVG